jgi:hypothetical protein
MVQNSVKGQSGCFWIVLVICFLPAFIYNMVQSNKMNKADNPVFQSEMTLAQNLGKTVKVENEIYDSEHSGFKVSKELPGLPLSKLNHKFSKYNLYYCENGGVIVPVITVKDLTTVIALKGDKKKEPFIGSVYKVSDDEATAQAVTEFKAGRPDAVVSEYAILQWRAITPMFLTLLSGFGWALVFLRLFIFLAPLLGFKIPI